MSSTHWLLFSLILLICFSCSPEVEDSKYQYDVIVIGDGTGATSAAIQAARSGAITLHITSLPWLGGMLTSAGVSAIDGNHEMPAGIWGEFRQGLRDHYGGAEALATGWVSHTQFEPSVADSILKSMAHSLENLTVAYETQYEAIEKSEDGWQVIANFEGLAKHTYLGDVLVDGTDLGDVAAFVGVKYDVGMDAREYSGEKMAPESSNDIIQDLTYVILLEDQGDDVELIQEPADYDPMEFDCACKEMCNDPSANPHPCQTMMTYAKLPNDKYLINWPIKGNDVYINVIELSREDRIEEYKKAKAKTLRFVYYIQHELGFDSLGIAKSEFPSIDGFPLMPYHREGRRIHGLERLTVNDILDPYINTLYRTGIAVGDYPIDHHHKERHDAPEIDFPMVPSFSVPMGALIPNNVDDLVIADKAISVTNIVNGSSRLQPVILQIGQAAGIMAALSAQENKTPAELSVRDVQAELLAAGGYIMPYWDVKPDDQGFEAIQKVAATGIMRGTGEPYKWANRTWFYPDRTATQGDLYFMDKESNVSVDTPITIESIGTLIRGMAVIVPEALKGYDGNQPLTRREVAMILDTSLSQFSNYVAMDGSFRPSN